MIKVGDLVKFFLKKTMPSKIGQVTQINDDETADVFVEADVRVYTIAISKLKKI